MSKFIKIVTFDTNVTQAERKKVTGYCDVQKKRVISLEITVRK